MLVSLRPQPFLCMWPRGTSLSFSPHPNRGIFWKLQMKLEPRLLGFFGAPAPHCTLFCLCLFSSSIDVRLLVVRMSLPCCFRNLTMFLGSNPEKGFVA